VLKVKKASNEDREPARPGLTLFASLMRGFQPQLWDRVWLANPVGAFGTGFRMRDIRIQQSSNLEK